MKVIDYRITVGLLADHANFNRKTMCSVCFAIRDNDTVLVTVESARNGNTMRMCGSKEITLSELNAAPRDAYDDLVFTKWAFDLMGLSAGITR
jgi:hypothetical protein